MGLVRRHPWIAGFLGLVFITGPGIAEFWWALFSNEPLLPTLAKKVGLLDMPDLSIGWLTVVTAPVGLALMAVIVLQTRRPKADSRTPSIPLPSITVIPTVGEGRAVLSVHNSGAEADFTAHARVLDEISGRGTTGYTGYWEGNHGRTCHIDRGGDAEILLGQIARDSSGHSVHDVIYQDGLMLYRVGGDGNEQPFGAHRIARTDEPDGVTAFRAEDACTVEMSITSTPTLSTAWGTHQYELSARGGDMRLTEVTPIPVPDTGGSGPRGAS